MTSSAPTTTLTVPAKPAAITAANLATLAGTAAVVAGPVGWAVAGAAAAVPVAVAAKKAAGRRKENRQRRTTTTTTAQRTASSPRVPRLGGSGGGAGSGRHRAAGALRGLASRATGRNANAGGAPRGGRPSGGGSTGKQGILRKLGIGSSTATPGSRKTNPKAKAGGGGQGGGRRGGSASRSRLARAAAAPMRSLGRFGRGLATRPGKKATTGSAYQRNRKRGFATALGAATRAATRNGWRAAGAWFRRFVLRRKPKKKVKNAAKKTAPKKTVAPTVDRGTPTQTAKPNQNSNPTAAPGRPIIPGDNTAAAKEDTMSSADTPSGAREMAARMWANVESWQPRGMLVVVEEYHDLPQTLEYMRATIGVLMDRSMKRFPVDPEIAQQIGKIVEVLDTAAAMSRKIPEAVETIHEKQLRRLRNPGVGEEMWDMSANGRA
ncbi:hypothetical protein AB0K35_27885 [Micromonospora sp. NPDC053740]|uniref:hypothetical protein n=1 Tax=Micromonospora sp. NPDC053740 TaxID=3155173 RepID=UPI0034222E82